MKTTTIAMMTGLALMIALPISAQRLAAQDMFFYPSKGQSPERQNTDRGECHVWAVQQSGFDPANPPAHATTLPAPALQGGAPISSGNRRSSRLPGSSNTMRSSPSSGPATTVLLPPACRAGATALADERHRRSGEVP
jgi:hypothetical protein